MSEIEPHRRMADLYLTRSTDDHRLYALGDLGIVRLQGFASRRATTQAAGASWRIARTGFWRRRIDAVDAAGAVVGTFEPHRFRRGGELRWAGRDLTIRPSSGWRGRYALADGERELAVFDGKSWGRRPVEISVDEAAAVEPGLLLFGAFVVRGLAEAAAAGAAATSAAAAAGG